MTSPPEARLDDRVREDLARRAEEATREAEFLPRERAEAALAEFRDRFGPDRLAALDGEALLLAMHGRGGEEESLAYWLEFKNDEVFPGRRFGSIAGGSAHKFDVYRRDRDGAWVTGTGISPRVIETEQASETVSLSAEKRIERQIRPLQAICSDARCSSGCGAGLGLG